MFSRQLYFRSATCSLLLLALSLSACKQQEKQVIETAAVEFDSAYKTPYFADAERVQKLRAAFPVADSMMTRYAIENHIPGFSYGIVVDGKLVHTLSFGYSDI